MPGLAGAAMRRKLHRAAPRPGTIQDGTATCLCGRPLIHVAAIQYQQDHWRHNPRREALR